MYNSRRLRVLSIAHPAVSRNAGRLRYYPLVARHDLDVHLVVPATWYEFGRAIVADPADDPGLKVHILPIRFGHFGRFNWYLHFYQGLRQIVEEVDPDVIHLWEEPWSIVALQATRLNKRSAFVMEVDQNILKRLPPPFEAIRKHVLRHTDHVLSRSQDAAAVVRARGYVGPVTSIGYGVDSRTFKPEDIAQKSKRPGFRIGYVGRLVEEKGIDDALDALAHCPESVTLAIMGRGPYQKALRRRIERLGIGDRVTFQGWGEPCEVASFLQSLDALILLSWTTRASREQFGRVIVEAQACGIPVIGSECGAIPDVIGDGGWVVPERDPESLAELLNSIAADPASVRLKGEAALANVQAHFTFEAVSEALASAFTTAFASRMLR